MRSKKKAIPIYRTVKEKEYLHMQRFNTHTNNYSDCLAYHCMCHLEPSRVREEKKKK